MLSAEEREALRATARTSFGRRTRAGQARSNELAGEIQEIVRNVLKTRGL
jgi:hypothetical protein